jgi:AcrR family transcriptional regulator
VESGSETEGEAQVGRKVTVDRKPTVGRKVTTKTGAAPARRGRRRNSEGETATARAEIIDAARREFSESGYDGVSLRAVARRAGVDAALVHHYFSDKADLFAATVDAPVRPDLLVADILRGPRDAIGASIVRTVLTRFDDRLTRDTVIALIRTALGHEFAARMLRQFLLREVLQRITDELRLDDGELRASLAASQLVGIIVARYGIRIGPLADASTDEIVSRIGPVVQWYLLGDPSEGSPPRS